ncbi:MULTISPECIES: hypothetical protein [unclassified Streptomyces]|uniref:hypothetical protein n=1 Tax=unclassified Streptomyces TaxID=2593676 RepID=UPI001BEB6E94|nr:MULTISPECIES: hypothetical protein [unclassified Streptomyces]MBT2406877.1 hypothetical protein [Streptomyces sp. ISL-21]MBT2613088.1 hypothetical protein [Streptomyces sp. ISL-87]
MTGLASLTWLIGTQALSDHIVARVNELIEAGTTYPQACTAVTDAVDAGEAWAIAATRQTWVRRPDTDEDDAPIRRLYVLERTGDTVVVADLDLDEDPDAYTNDGLKPSHLDLGDEEQGAVVDVDLLNLYDLTAWEPFEHLLPTAAVPAAGTTGVGE